MRFKEYLAERYKPPITKHHLKELERYADALFAAVGVDVEFTKHFAKRANDPRNKEQITLPELQKIFKDTYQKYGAKIPNLGDKAEAVLQDMETDINIPFVLRWDSKSQEFDLINKTVMRKKGFKTRNRRFVV